MPFTINVGFSEKLGRPDFGSIGASCNVQCECDGRLMDDVNAFQANVQLLYAACFKAVQEELQRHPPGNSNGRRTTSSDQRTGAAAQPPEGSNGSANHRASKRQLDYMQQLARQIDGLGARGLQSLTQRICGKPMADLTTLDASSVIDTLKAMKDGRLDVQAALKGGGG
jgi:hypothetical protein